MKWFNEPSRWSEDDGCIVADADPHTDFWRITDYGYVRDNAHIYGEAIDSDFRLTVRVQADFATQYDQAGVSVRLDESHWIKTGVELFENKLRFSTVVTIDSSNWMIADLPDDFDILNLSIARMGDALHISYSTGEDQVELAAIVFVQPHVGAFAGVMCASPEGEGFTARFSDFALSIPETGPTESDNN
jgi:regulation of enolase protein 1 (concanavalin A-like superfamily)